MGVRGEARGPPLRSADQAFLRKVLDATPSMVFVKDRDGRFVLVNEALARCYGTTVAGIVGKTDADFNPNREEVEHFRRDDVEVMDSRREKLISEEPVTCADGLVRWFSTVKVPLVEDDGSCDKILGVATDITARKDAEEAFRRSEERFRRLVESSSMGLVIGDEAGRLTYVNQSLLELIGYTGEDLEQGRLRWDTLTPPEYLEFDARAIAELKAVGRTAPYEKVYVTKDGRRVPVQLGVVPLERNATGELVMAAYVVDLSARKQAEEALREADRRKDEFLAMLAHELRNPLAAIVSAAHVIRGRLAQGETVERPLEILERQTQNSARLLDDLLDVSRITRGVLHLKKESVRLDAVVHSAIDSQRGFIDAARLELSVTLPHAPITIEGDPTRLEQIIANLINNAAKYTPEGGKISVTVERRDGEASVRVRDTGIGIPPDLLARVFDLFVQEHQSLARTKGGLGLGLTLVRKLVALHGGRVEARSEGSGKGSEFVVWLPAEPRPVEASAGPGAAERPRGDHGDGSPAPLRVLVVEDNQDAAELLADHLGSLGHDVTVTYDGPAALEAAPRVLPHVVLLDIGLPRVDGFEVARQLRDDPRLRGAVLIAVTGYGQEEDRRRSREAGFAHHLTKPVDPSTLERFIAAVAAECPWSSPTNPERARGMEAGVRAAPPGTSS